MAANTSSSTIPVDRIRGAPPETGRVARDLSYLEKRWVFILVFVGGVLANAFNDGNFGFSWSSLVTLIAVACSLAIGVTVPALVGGMYHTARHGSSPRKLMALPAGLALAVVMVVFSRLINFEPGYLYGFVCGVLFTRELPTNERASGRAGRVHHAGPQRTGVDSRGFRSTPRPCDPVPSLGWCSSTTCSPHFS